MEKYHQGNYQLGNCSYYIHSWISGLGSSWCTVKILDRKIIKIMTMNLPFIHTMMMTNFTSQGPQVCMECCKNPRQLKKKKKHCYWCWSFLKLPFYNYQNRHSIKESRVTHRYSWVQLYLRVVDFIWIPLLTVLWVALNLSLFWNNSKPISKRQESTSWLVNSSTPLRQTINAITGWHICLITKQKRFTHKTRQNFGSSTCWSGHLSDCASSPTSSPSKRVMGGCFAVDW